MPHVVFVPSSPLLAAGPLTGEVPEALEMRAAAHDATKALVAAAPRRVLVLATADDAEEHDETAGGTLHAHGLDVEAGGGQRVLGLGHTLGAWLLDQVGWTGPRAYVAAPAALGDDDALLVVADGSARRTDRAPGHLDPRAAPFDEVLLAALEDGDALVLGGVDETLAAEVWCSTSSAWRAAGDLVAARLVTERSAAEGPDARRDAPATRVRLAEAPLGVGWFVAEWIVP